MGYFLFFGTVWIVCSALVLCFMAGAKKVSNRPSIYSSGSALEADETA